MLGLGGQLLGKQVRACPGDEVSHKAVEHTEAQGRAPALLCSCAWGLTCEGQGLRGRLDQRCAEDGWIEKCAEISAVHLQLELSLQVRG